MSADRPDGESSPYPPCSECGGAVAAVTVFGPMAAIATPCGCSVSPKMFDDADREPDDDPE